MAFSEIAKELRESQGFSQKELSKHIGISSSGIGALETGRNGPTASTLIAYAKFFEITIEELVGCDSPTLDEQAAGASATRRVNITPIEDELLHVFRRLGKKYDEKTQRGIIDMIEKML